jgi:hypothetical protein
VSLRRVRSCSWLVAAALLATACGGGGGGGDEAAPTEPTSSTTEGTTTTTQPPPRFVEVSTAQYERSDGVRWFARLHAADINPEPWAVRQPRHCDFSPGRDAVVPIKLQIEGVTRGAASFAKLVLTDGSLSPASYPTGHLQYLGLIEPVPRCGYVSPAPTQQHALTTT